MSQEIEKGAAERTYSNKILAVQRIIECVGNFPRDRKVIMCHGTFDHLHVGHIRQLEFATTKAPILVVSITCDEHIAKGELRPWVPQELRAKHLASLEFVDFVVIDNNPTPIENITLLQPDIFVKGFEYSKSGIHPKTQEEIDVIHSYGGEMMFSPGDIVYSSSQILSHERPNLSFERIIDLMRQEKITFNDLRNSVEKIKGIPIIVIGDLIIDRYNICSSQIGQSQEEDVPSYLFAAAEEFVGGAGVVAKHLKDLGAEVTFITVVGNDLDAQNALSNLRKEGICVSAYIDKTRPTTVKERFVNKNGRLLFKVNRLESRTISDDTVGQITNELSKSRSSAVICSDFRHGIFNNRTLEKIVKAIPHTALKIADSQVSTRWGNILDFQDFDIITPNEREARWALADQDTGIRPLSQDLYIKANCKNLLLKLGKDGLIVYRSPGIESREYYYLESLATNVIDHVGAGDALLAASTATFVASKNIVISSIVGNIAAALECSKRGNIPVSDIELVQAISKLEERTKGL